MSKRYKRLLSVIISIVLLAGIATAVGTVDIFSLKNSEQAAMASDLAAGLAVLATAYIKGWFIRKQ